MRIQTTLTIPEEAIDEPCDTTDLIDAIDARVAEPDRDPRTRRFMMEACHGLAELLPPRAAHWLEVARAYAAGEASPAELTETRLEAWKHLGNRSCAFDDPAVNAVRAVIFVLDPENKDDWFDNMIFFIDYCEGAGADRERLCRQLRETFADVLG